MGSAGKARWAALVAIAGAGGVAARGCGGDRPPGDPPTEAAKQGLAMWAAPGSMNVPRVGPTLTVLASGRVLVVGGDRQGGTAQPPAGSLLPAAEMYYPAHDAWAEVAIPVEGPRRSHTATLLTGGRVLVAGGVKDVPLASSEVFDVGYDGFIDSTWAVAASLLEPRFDHTAVLLLSGEVLVAGGRSSHVLASVERYDPEADRWRAAAPMHAARAAHSATRLANGTVLVAGGEDGASLASAEIYDPARDAWAPAGPLLQARARHQAVLLPNGEVLITGGDNGGALQTAERFAPSRGFWAPTGPLNVPRTSHGMALLTSGLVLVAGGRSSAPGIPGTSLESREVYETSLERWSTMPALRTARAGAPLVALPDGRGLSVGGDDNGTALTTDELYGPGTRALGAACGASGDCTSGICAGGVCCDRTCDLACSTCALGSGVCTSTGQPVACTDNCGNEGHCVDGACYGFDFGHCCDYLRSYCVTEGRCYPNVGCFCPPVSDGTACDGPSGSACQSGVCVAPALMDAGPLDAAADATEGDGSEPDQGSGPADGAAIPGPDAGDASTERPPPVELTPRLETVGPTCSAGAARPGRAWPWLLAALVVVVRRLSIGEAVDAPKPVTGRGRHFTPRGKCETHRSMSAPAPALSTTSPAQSTPSVEPHGGLHPLFWVPTLYFAMGTPMNAVSMVATIMYKNLGLTNTQAALYTSSMYLPWVIKPIWAPVLELFGTKKQFVIATELIMTLTLGCVALALGTPSWLTLTLTFFWITAFTSATQDIAGDGVYVTSLNNRSQAAYAGVQGAFWNVGKILVVGGLVSLTGRLHDSLALSWFGAWAFVMALMAGILAASALWHLRFLPQGARAADAPRNLADAMGTTFDAWVSFFKKKRIWMMLAVVFFYRFGEGFVEKIGPMFMMEARDKHGLGLSIEALGWINGTIGTAGFIGGTLTGGLLIARYGLRRTFLPLGFALNVPHITYFYLSQALPTDLVWIGTVVTIEKIGYGFGTGALMVYMMQELAPGRYKTAHYAFATGIMGLCMMLTGMVSGWLQEHLGYQGFFIFMIAASVPPILLAWLAPFQSSGSNEPVASEPLPAHAGPSGSP